ncbi:MAG: hypothetical protein KC978_22165, partial [Candidatus Omnitrophica bacterium]|nr:hypothetical protein [Candidatus Omnitrophota bacterium]
MNRKHSFLGVSSLLLALLVWIAVKPFFPERDVEYTITDLDTLGGIYSYALELNDKGHVAGVRLVSAT